MWAEIPPQPHNSSDRLTDFRPTLWYERSESRPRTGLTERGEISNHLFISFRENLEAPSLTILSDGCVAHQDSNDISRMTTNKTLLAIIVLASLAVPTQELFGQQIHPRWSPDGSQVVTFERIRDSSSVRVWSTVGSEVETVATGAWFANPTWSPDKSRLAAAYGAKGMQDSWRLAIIDLATGAVKPLQDLPGREMHSSWSPDGGWIAFVINTGDGSDVHIIRPDGTEHRRLTNTPEREFHPKWSADGRYLTFDRTLAGGLGEIVVFNVETGQTAVPELPAGVGAGTPSFHPSGDRVAFAHRLDGQSEIASIGVDGSGLHIHTGLGGSNGAPVWSPDGSSLAFHHNGAREAGVYILEIESGSVRPLGSAPR